jgi:carbonic anhydrase
MGSIAKKLLVLVALVASTACKHPESEETETSSSDLKEDHADGEEKVEKPREKAARKADPKAHDSEGPRRKGKARPKAPEPESKPEDEKLSRVEKGHAEEPADLLGKKEHDVPFIEGHRDPLALTRGFLRDVLADNAKYMQKHDATFFKDFAIAQTPRATVVTCSDSRVQSSAFDTTAENDDFMVRNIGNQLGNSEGSVEYGIHHLHTPVLFILGHTGCGAVKAAMGDFSKESEAINHELSSLHVPARKEGVKDDDPKQWLDAVVDNVNDQVALAVTKFDDELSRGVLTIVGAVYDFRNDLKQGPGKVAIVNVNGVTDQAKLKAFTRSVGGTVVDEEPAPGHGPKDAPALSSLSELRQALAHIPARAASNEAASDVVHAAVNVAHPHPHDEHAVVKTPTHEAAPKDMPTKIVEP